MIRQRRREILSTLPPESRAEYLDLGKAIKMVRKEEKKSARRRREKQEG